MGFFCCIHFNIGAYTVSDITIPVAQVVTLQFTMRDQDGGILDVSTAIAPTLVVKRVGAAAVDKILSLVTDGTDGLVKYTTLSTDLDVPGIWRLQGKVTLSGEVFHSDVLSFEVTPNL